MRVIGRAANEKDPSKRPHFLSPGSDKVVIQELLSKKDNVIYKVGPSPKSCQSLVRDICFLRLGLGRTRHVVSLVPVCWKHAANSCATAWRTQWGARVRARLSWTA